MKYLIFLILVFGVLLIGCETIQDGTITHEPSPDDNVGFDGITKQECETAYGHWNECGSPCAGTNAKVCIAMCQVQCECGGIAGFGCPSEYKCRLSGKIADEMGVCVKE